MMTKKKILLSILVSFLPFLLIKGQNFAISTNVLDYVNYGTINIDASYALAQHWSINTTFKYNPFSYNADNGLVMQKQRSISTGARYWPWHIYSGWWLSALLKFQEYRFGGKSSPQTTEGNRFGGAFGGGYTMMLSPHLNLDFGAMLWTGYDKYISYACQTCGKRVDSGNKAFFLPSDIVIALTYIF